MLLDAVWTCAAEWSKQKWMSFKASFKVPNEGRFFSLELREYLFLTHSSSLLSFWGSPLSQSSPCCEWTEIMLSLSGRELGSLPLTTACPKLSQGTVVIVETECGAWPVAELCGDLCALRSLINVWNSWGNWWKTTCEQYGGQICCIAEFWEQLLTGKDYSKQCMCMVCGVMQRKTPTPVASSPCLSAGAEELSPLASAAVPLCLQSSGRARQGGEVQLPFKNKWRTGRSSWSVSSCLLMQVYFPLRHNWERCTHTMGRSDAVVYVHALGLEKCPYPVSKALYFGSSFVQAPACCQNMYVFPGTWDRFKFLIPPENTLCEPSPWAGIERTTFLFLLLTFKHDPVLQFMKSKLWIPIPLGFSTSCLWLWDNMPGKVSGFMKPQPGWIMLAVYLEMQLVSWNQK